MCLAFRKSPIILFVVEKIKLRKGGRNSIPNKVKNANEELTL